MQLENRELMADSKFKGKLNPLELAACDLFVLIVQIFLWFHRAVNDADLINKLTGQQKMKWHRFLISIFFT